MSRVDDVKSFARNAPHEYTAEITEPSIDSMIDATIAEFHNETGMERSEVEESITKVELLRSGAGSIALRHIALRHNGGPIPIPHKCHKKIEICWPHPEDPELEVCLEIEIPWPCPKNDSDGGWRVE
jgi:hypothetical protein